MKREDFKKIIKIRSFWKIDRRKGNYKLPNGERLSDYVIGLVESQMKLDHLGIQEDGNLTFVAGGNWNEKLKKFENYTLMPPYEKNENCEYDEMERRIIRIVNEIIGN